MTRVKICGLTNLDDLIHACAEGADAVGIVIEPTSPRYVELARAEEMAEYAGPYCVTVAVYGQYRGPRPRTHAVQAVEFIEPSPHFSILSVRPTPGQTAAQIVETQREVSTILLDAYSPDAFGGTGKRVDWELAAEIARTADRPLVLAGGLTPDNVVEAITQVRPYAVDVSSGVESSPGIKDRAKVRDFIQAVRSVSAHA